MCLKIATGQDRWLWLAVEVSHHQCASCPQRHEMQGIFGVALRELGLDISLEGIEGGLWAFGQRLQGGLNRR